MGVFMKSFGIVGAFSQANLVVKVQNKTCAARAAWQTGCVANEVATKFIVFVLFSFLSLFYALLIFSQKGLT
jgi:hypothetical protein